MNDLTIRPPGDLSATRSIQLPRKVLDHFAGAHVSYHRWRSEIFCDESRIGLLGMAQGSGDDDGKIRLCEAVVAKGGQVALNAAIDSLERATRHRASDQDVARILGAFLGCYRTFDPGEAPEFISGFLYIAQHELDVAPYSAEALTSVCIETVKTQKFIPAIAEIIQPIAGRQKAFSTVLSYLERIRAIYVEAAHHLIDNAGVERADVGLKPSSDDLDDMPF